MNVVRHTLLNVALGGSVLTVAWAQAPDARPVQTSNTAVSVPKPAAAKQPDEPPRPPRRGPRHLNSFAFPMGEGGFGEFTPRAMKRGHKRQEQEEQEMEAFDQALSKLKSAKDDAERTSATKELSQSLEKLFQRDLERREHQVAEIEARVKKLHEQIEKRKKAKDDILSLHLKTIINEADGLGFPGHFEHDGDSHAPDFRWFMRSRQDDEPRDMVLPPPEVPDVEAPPVAP